jgi:hypothetical protein
VFFFFLFEWHVNCGFTNKIVMAKDHKGKPPGDGKGNLDIKPVMPAENLQRDEEAKKPTRDEDGSTENIRHPNRNTDKDDATNAEGYKK